MKRGRDWWKVKIRTSEDRLKLEKRTAEVTTTFEKPVDSKSLYKSKDFTRLDEINFLIKSLQPLRVIIAGSFALSTFLGKLWRNQDIDFFIPIPADVIKDDEEDSDNRDGSFLRAKEEYVDKVEKIIEEIKMKVVRGPTFRSNKRMKDTFYAATIHGEDYDDDNFFSKSFPNCRSLKETLMSNGTEFDIVLVLVPSSIMKENMTDFEFDNVVRYVIDSFDLDICRIALVPWRSYPKNKPFHSKTTKNMKELERYIFITAACSLKRRLQIRDIRNMILELIKKDIQGNGLSYDPFFSFVKGHRFNERAALEPQKNFAVMEWIPLRLFIDANIDPSLRETDDPNTVYHFTTRSNKTLLNLMKEGNVNGSEKLRRITKYQERGFMIAEFPSRVEITSNLANTLSKIQGLLEDRKKLLL